MKYKVIIDYTAENDLVGILHYIANTLHEPNVAKRIYKSIKEQILSLEEIPLRYPLINEEPYRTAGVRKILVEGYTAFYLVNSADMTVHVFRILYSRREWQHLL